MGVLKDAKYHGYAFDNAEGAVNYLYGSEYRTVILYNYRRDRLAEICQQVYKEIKKRNTEIPDVNKQMLPTEPYYFDDIDGCLGVKCAEIGMDEFEKCAGNLYIFSQPNYDCLTDPSVRKPLSSKALSSIALMGHLISGGT
ncbi:MAG: hypothetical protein NC548_12820 [Lachnospiraceae bacterium]|nr:hypothetical protein [Lachnospiraceae bacterium]MCM1230727.1 hypothetical protein [Ruminococcus flavefaciens]